jgi:hypothetical protein
VEFMLLFIDRKGAPARVPEGMAALARLASELRREGRLLRGGPLAAEAEGVRVVVRDGGTFVTEGPFAESREVVGGFWLVDAESRDEAIAIARRVFETGEPRPEARHGAVDVHVVAQRYCVAGDPGTGKAWWYAFHNDPGLVDCGQEKLREMIAYGEALERDGKLFETAPLRFATPAARVSAAGGKTLVTEGPFAEAKEVIGGYSLLRAASREEALAIAKGYPAARWGTLELREIVEPEPG